MSKKVTAYPRNVSAVDYASFLRIHRLQYKKGLAKAGGATESLLLSGLAGTLGGAAELVATAYNRGNGKNAAQNAFSEAQQQVASAFTEKANMTGRSKAKFEEKFKEKGIDAIPDSVFEGLKDDSGNPLTKETLKSLQQAANQEKNRDAVYIDVAMPNEMAYGYGAAWNNTFKIGTLAQAFNSSGGLGSAAALGIAGAGAGVGLNALSNLKTKAGGVNLTQIAGAGGAGAAKALNPFGINSSINPLDPKGATNLAGLAGMAPNENAVQFFQNIEFREFQFDFEIFCPEVIDRHIGEKIVKFFKYGMHPSAPAGTGVLDFPDVFIIEPMFKAKGKEPSKHYLMPNTKSCALTNFRVNVTPMNSIQTTFDGTFPLITISCTFKELTALVREDLDKGY